MSSVCLCPSVCDTALWLNDNFMSYTPTGKVSDEQVNRKFPSIDR